MRYSRLYGALLTGVLSIGGATALAGESHPPIEYRALKIEDFPIRAHVPPNVDAYTNVRMTFHPQQKTVQDGNMWHSEVVLMEISCSMYPDKSWRRAKLKDEKATLVHEQGHFDICEGKARLLRMQTLGAYPVGRGSDSAAAEADLTHALNGYFAKRFEEMGRENKKYDKETKQGRAAPKQQAWTDRLGKSVKE